MVDCWLPYGSTEVYVSVEMDYLLGIAEPEMVEPVKPSSEIIVDALTDPSGKKLEELLGRETTVAIAVDNYANPGVIVQTLRELVKTLVELIVPKNRITVVVGGGEHERDNSLVAKAIRENSELRGVQVVVHTRDTSNLAEYGSTNMGTLVTVNKAYGDASLKIAIGETKLDQYSGFSGAQNAIIPGISGIETIKANRIHYLDGKSTPGTIELNPIKEDIVEAVKAVGIDFSVNLVTNIDGQLVAAHAGTFEESWGRAMNSLANMYEAPSEGKADIVLVSAGGAPYDQSLYTASLALLNGVKAAKNNGTIILLAECGGGLGAEAYTQLAQVTEASEFKRRYMYGAEAMLTVKNVLKSNRVILVSALPAYIVESLGMEPARNSNEAYARAIQTRRDRRTIVIPHGITSMIM